MVWIPPNQKNKKINPRPRLKNPTFPTPLRISAPKSATSPLSIGGHMSSHRKSRHPARAVQIPRARTCTTLHKPAAPAFCAKRTQARPHIAFPNEATKPHFQLKYQPQSPRPAERSHFAQNKPTANRARRHKTKPPSASSKPPCPRMSHNVPFYKCSISLPIPPALPVSPPRLRSSQDERGKRDR